MKSDKTLLSINDHNGLYAEMYKHYFLHHSNQSKLIFDDPDSIGMVSFTGGEDVSPEMYNERRGCYTHNNINRDMLEKEVFEQALKHNIPMVGICRGSQFLNVMCGGHMIQDVTNHAGNLHYVETYTGNTMLVTSTHHQMSVITDEAITLAWAWPRISKHYMNGNDENIEAPPREVEAFVYPDYNVIGWQYHPEMVKSYSREDLKDCVHFVNDTLNEFIFSERGGKINDR